MTTETFPKIRKMTPLLNVADVSRSILFYEGLIGFEIVTEFEADGVAEWALLRAGDVEIMLNEGDAGDSESRRRLPPFSGQVLYFDVEDCQALHTDLLSRGFRVDALEPQEYGVLEFRLRDPDGYELAFTTPIDDDNLEI
ncbi:MAG: VOC family protein [Alphaproteobacteria bacterium]|nr:VOC family protein [Alphaproteobacteria bacterium]